jgi:hypothetical protein
MANKSPSVAITRLRAVRVQDISPRSVYLVQSIDHRALAHGNTTGFAVFRAYGGAASSRTRGE